MSLKKVLEELSEIMISSTLAFHCMAASSFCTCLSVTLASKIHCRAESCCLLRLSSQRRNEIMLTWYTGTYREKT